VSPPIHVPRQPSLFGASQPDFDRAFTTLRRIQLDAESWVEHAPRWVTGAETLFEQVLAARNWGQRTRLLWDKQMVEPRLTSHWDAASREPLEPAIVDAMRVALSARYGVALDSCGFNLYRDGRDSVAWHGDRIRREIREPIVALVSLGAPRRFLLRPAGGGTSLKFDLGGGDLFVTGGRTQRSWQHSVPKVARAGPRISIAFRHGLSATAYGRVATPSEPGDGGTAESSARRS
jgi:alkylated DNA repair dioxygenase AlkB